MRNSNTLSRLAFRPSAWINRVWDSGEYLFELTFGAEAETRYGAPYLLMHRGDLHAALFSAVPPELILFDRRLVGLDRGGAGLTLRFADGSSALADVVIGVPPDATMGRHRIRLRFSFRHHVVARDHRAIRVA